MKAARRYIVSYILVDLFDIDDEPMELESIKFYATPELMGEGLSFENLTIKEIEVNECQE